MSSHIDTLNAEAREAGTIINTDNGTKLFLRTWMDDGSSSTAIIIFHGITAHSKSYTDIAEALTDLGYDVYGLDLRGHGLSGGTRADYPSHEQVQKDLQITLNHVLAEHDSVLFLGHSMGVTTSLLAYKNMSQLIDGMIFLSGRIKIPDLMIPDLGIIDKIKIGFASTFLPHKPVIPIKLPEGFVETDEFYTFTYTRRFFDHLEIGRLSLPDSIDIPVFVAVGDSDELWTIGEMREFFDLLPAPEKEFSVIDGERHASLSANAVNTDLKKWLSQNFVLDTE